MSRIFFEITWQVDDGNGLKRTFLKQKENVKSEESKKEKVGEKCIKKIWRQARNWRAAHHFLLTLAQIPQPMQRSSEIKAILSVGATSIHSLPGWERNAKIWNERRTVVTSSPKQLFLSTQTQTNANGVLSDQLRFAQEVQSGAHPFVQLGRISYILVGTSLVCTCRCWRWQSWSTYLATCCS